MLKSYKGYIDITLLIIVIVLYNRFYDYKYVNEVFLILALSSMVYQMVKKLTMKTNGARVVIKTKKINWFSGIFYFGFGISFLFSNDGSVKFIFGYVAFSHCVGLIFLLKSISMYQPIIINKEGLLVPDWYRPNLKFNDVRQFDLTNTNLEIVSDEFTYHYKIFKLNDETVELINATFEEWKTI